MYDPRDDPWYQYLHGGSDQPPEGLYDSNPDWNVTPGDPSYADAPPVIGPPGTGTNNSSAVAGPADGDFQTWFMNLVAGKPWNQQTLLDLEPILNQFGFKLTPPNAVGDRTKIQLPNGQWVRVGFGEGQPVWVPQGNATGADYSGINPDSIGSLLKPFPGSFAPGAPSLDMSQFSFPQFSLPSGQDVLDEDPGYDFRFGQGRRSILQDRASRGILNTGGTLKDLVDYGQKAASQEYSNAVDRRLNTFRTNYGVTSDRNQMVRDIFDSSYRTYMDQYQMFRDRQQDTNQYLTDQQRLGVEANG